MSLLWTLTLSIAKGLCIHTKMPLFLQAKGAKIERAEQGNSPGSCKHFLSFRIPPWLLGSPQEGKRRGWPELNSWGWPGSLLLILSLVLNAICSTIPLVMRWQCTNFKYGNSLLNGLKNCSVIVFIVPSFPFCPASIYTFIYLLIYLFILEGESTRSLFAPQTPCCF